MISAAEAEEEEGRDALEDPNEEHSLKKQIKKQKSNSQPRSESHFQSSSSTEGPRYKQQKQ
jgi:hypothetical protein